MHRVFDIIKQKLNEGYWTWANVKGLMDYGVVEGIYTKLQSEERDNKTRRAATFREDEDIKTMRKIEQRELDRRDQTPKEFLQYARKNIDFGTGKEWSLIYKKYGTNI